jgi:hypothetical protein
METVPVQMGFRRLAKYNAYGVLFEVIEWHEGQAVVFTPESPEWDDKVLEVFSEG